MPSTTSLPKALLAKRQEELAKMGKTGRIPLADVFRMVYENISENPMVKEFAPEELKGLRTSIDEVQNRIATISKKVQERSGKGPKEPGGKGSKADQTEQAAGKGPPTTQRQPRK
jgi:hypothetical protein